MRESRKICPGGGVVQGIIVFVWGGGLFFRGQFLIILRYYYVNLNMFEFSGAGGGVPRITTLPLSGHGGYIRLPINKMV